MTKVWSKRVLLSCVFVIVTAATHFISRADDGEKIFKTGYCDIYYGQDATLSGFIWRISGKRLNFEEDMGLARSRVDRIVDRVQAILDMYPDALRIKILLYPEYKEGDIASYSHKDNRIKVYADKVTDGIFAHEVAHAVICGYFDTPPPAKMQEILTQYVDRQLWDDY